MNCARKRWHRWPIRNEGARMPSTTAPMDELLEERPAHHGGPARTQRGRRPQRRASAGRQSTHHAFPSSQVGYFDGRWFVKLAATL